ncbi:MAG TPA: TonB-dependent receptor [Alphaproteobacteria bacterium]|nr:TonB-dependent receptor [Alphaproteobacteria bacterium]
MKVTGTPRVCGRGPTYSNRHVRARTSAARAAIVCALIAGTLTIARSAVAAAPSIEDLSRLSIEELSAIDLQVTSVSRRPEPLSKAPAAIYVITQDDIRRAGVTSLTEALRLAPNLEVAQLNASTYTVSARGFNRFEAANKLQVLIDGRTVYNPLHAGVFWDVANVMVEDIDRIEVISGPGGALWGTNAVNGVINVVTKGAEATRGGLASAQIGNVNRNGALRYGGALGSNGAYRVYGMTFADGHTVNANGTSLGDDWYGSQGGFRTDWKTDGNAFTVQGDVFNNPFHTGGQARGGNALARWTHTLGAASSVEVQTYYDKTERVTPGVVDAVETGDLQAQHTFATGAHKVVWGGGYRVQTDRFSNTLNGFALNKERDTTYIGNVFAQDTIALDSDLALTLGTKLEHSTFSGTEYMPEARLGWSVTDDDFLWGAVSRAVRTPSRIDRELQFPGLLLPAPSFDSEKLIAYEIGHRGRLSPRASGTLALYYHDYDDLRTTSLANGSTFPVQLQNGMEGSTYGLEAWGDYALTSWWRLSPGLNVIKKHLHLKPGQTDTSNRQAAGNDPEYQASLRSSMDLGRDVEFDIGIRAVDQLSNPSIPSYYSLDTRVGWTVTPGVELSLAGFNLLDSHHPETGPAPQAEIRRTVYVGTRWRF